MISNYRNFQAFIPPLFEKNQGFWDCDTYGINLEPNPPRNNLITLVTGIMTLESFFLFFPSPLSPLPLRLLGLS